MFMSKYNFISIKTQYSPSNLIPFNRYGRALHVHVY